MPCKRFVSYHCEYIYGIYMVCRLLNLSQNSTYSLWYCLIQLHMELQAYNKSAPSLTRGALGFSCYVAGFLGLDCCN